MIDCCRQKPFNYLASRLSSVQRELQPVIHPLFRRCREVRCIKQNQIKLAADRIQEVSPDNGYTFGSGICCGMRIDLRCCCFLGNGHYCLGNSAGTGSDLQNPVRLFDFCKGSADQQVCILCREIDLRGIRYHGISAESLFARSMKSVIDNISGRISSSSSGRVAIRFVTGCSP